jgi:hypothetical protein
MSLINNLNYEDDWRKKNIRILKERSSLLIATGQFGIGPKLVRNVPSIKAQFQNIILGWLAHNLDHFDQA